MKSESVEIMVPKSQVWNVVYCDLCEKRVGPNLAADGTMAPMKKFMSLALVQGHAEQVTRDDRHFCEPCFLERVAPLLRTIGLERP